MTEPKILEWKHMTVPKILEWKHMTCFYMEVV